MADTLYQQNTNFIYRKIVDESILVPVHLDVADMNCIYTLNEVGNFIWEALASPKSRADLQAQLNGEYDVDINILTSDLDRFLQEMTSIGAIKEV